MSGTFFMRVEAGPDALKGADDGGSVWGEGNAPAKAEFDAEFGELGKFCTDGVGFGGWEITFEDDTVEAEINRTPGAGRGERAGLEYSQNGDVFGVCRSGEGAGPIGFWNEEAVDG